MNTTFIKCFEVCGVDKILSAKCITLIPNNFKILHLYIPSYANNLLPSTVYPLEIFGKLYKDYPWRLKMGKILV